MSSYFLCFFRGTTLQQMLQKPFGFKSKEIACLSYSYLTQQKTSTFLVFHALSIFLSIKHFLCHKSLYLLHLLLKLFNILVFSYSLQITTTIPIQQLHNFFNLDFFFYTCLHDNLLSFQIVQYSLNIDYIKPKQVHSNRSPCI